MKIGENIQLIREAKNFSQEYMSQSLGISQPSYSKIESGQVVPKTDRLQQIANILEVDLLTLLNTANTFTFTFNSVANQSGYISNQTNNSIDMEILKKIIQETVREEIQNFKP
jgi:transcriptional regulator with XRE-family HTH domain